jgi:hypothetical protein
MARASKPDLLHGAIRAWIEATLTRRLDIARVDAESRKSPSEWPDFKRDLVRQLLEREW